MQKNQRASVHWGFHRTQNGIQVSKLASLSSGMALGELWGNRGGNVWGEGEDQTECSACTSLWEFPEAVARKLREKKLMTSAGAFCFILFVFRNFSHLFPQ